ncbi:unnamed protein product [Linum tenue]|uniref:FAD-binding FR-type domain-containing protein n=1 Tax=Linum tenue TaxID=586396 RepID=A0AAV0J005_9ROSI|nr:unnamed protein product [Linum tenue]
MKYSMLPEYKNQYSMLHRRLFFPCTISRMTWTWGCIIKTWYRMKCRGSPIPLLEENKQMRNLNAVVGAVLLVALVGWLMIWVMLPTKAYKNSWDPNLSSTHFNSVYFQGQGTNLLLFSFPVMFIAALGCVYLHFHTRLQEPFSSSEVKPKLISPLWRPYVISPLGIVTGVELAFMAMFIALLIWSLANYVYVSFGHLHMHKQGEKIWQAKFRSVSLRLGYVGNICWAFLFFPVTRGSSLLPLLGLTSESTIKYHIWLGHVSNVLFALHTIGFVVYWGMTNQMSEMLEWSRTYVSNVAGEIAMVIAVVMWVTSFGRVRRKMFEVFFYTHHLYVLYILFYLLHVGADYLCMILPGMFLFMIDRYLRFLQSQRNARLISARLLPCGSVELNFSKCPGLKYNPTSILFINIPTISKLQWHPFTVTSNSNLEPNNLSLVVKSLGSWSRKLSQQISSSVDRLQVSVEGPYGPISSHFLRHEELVLISGGSGITPFISIIREIIFQSSNPNPQIPSRILLICAFKNSTDLAMLDLLLPFDGTPHPIPELLNLQIEAYITREKDQPTDSEKQPAQTKRFNPAQSDGPISANLGPNAWLWLGAIILSSFALFVVLLGVVTRFYIYPIDRNAHDGSYHYSYFVLWDGFLACAGVLAVSSAVFLVKKRRDLAEGNRVKGLEVGVSPPPPGSFVGEVESVPVQCVAGATNVHFGRRPDLKTSDVGVMACGSRSLRHEVAQICSPGSAQNLHFESISFNW